MLFKAFISGRPILQSVGRFRSEVSTTWHIRDSAVALSSVSVSQPMVAPLPRLPVPQLQQTLQKYLRTVKPVVTDNEYLQTEKLVKEYFSNGAIGEKLQFLLEERARRTENWLSDWWLSTAYLEYRWPVVVYSSPGLVGPRQVFFSKSEQLRYAAKAIAGALDFKIMIDANQVPLEMMGGKPLDMSQYSKVFSTCRIPGEKKDSLAHYSVQTNPPTHIIVVHNNHFFKVEVFNKNGQVLNSNQIENLLREVVAQSAQKAAPIGILTTEHRDVWGAAYKKLKKDKMNKESVEEIQRGIFVACIDQPLSFVSSDNPRSQAGMISVHGCGSRNNAGNRWFDKTVQLVFGADGEVCFTYEHSPAEGPPIAQLMDHMITHASSKTSINSPASNPSPPKRLDFNVNEQTKEDIEIAARDLDNLVNDVEFVGYEFSAYGKNFIKSQKLSPDSYLQMAFQLTFYRLHNEPAACYESASTRLFLHGRTETIRSTSVESVVFCKAMLGSNCTVQEKVQHMRNAINGHKQYVSDAVNGLGVDRHLLGLKLTALENGLEVPRVFTDNGYKRSSHFRMSTSQVAAKCDAFMIYGPLVPDGYGCCYNPREKSLIFGLSAFNSCPTTSAMKFRDALHQSLTDMHDVLVLSQSSKL